MCYRRELPEQDSRPTAAGEGQTGHRCTRSGAKHQIFFRVLQQQKGMKNRPFGRLRILIQSSGFYPRIVY